MKKNLLALDFDHTIVDDNSDTLVQKLAQNSEIPDRIKKLYKSGGWILFMNEVFRLLHGQGITRQHILDFIVTIKWTAGMKELLKACHQKDFETIIISDSNSVFIDSILVAAEMNDVVHAIFTNSADFDSSGQLHVHPYHQQDWCNLSTENLCKGHILDRYVQDRSQQGVTFNQIAYVGDGTNDFCPSLRLSTNDLVFARNGYSLLKLIKENSISGNRHRLCAKVISWDTGFDIMDVLLNPSQQHGTKY